MTRNCNCISPQKKMFNFKIENATINDLETVLIAYKNNLEKGYNSNELLPTQNKFVSQDILNKYKNK